MDSQDDGVSLRSAAVGTWAATNPNSLLWAVWDTDTHLFNADSGETHLLSELPATLLRALCRCTWNFDALCAHLARLSDTANGTSWQDKIAGVLVGLRDLELVERRADECPHNEPGQTSALS
jgi:PqqD family protein of HPr-rel-A system